MKIGIFGSGMIVSTALAAISGMEDVSCEAIWCRESGRANAQRLKEEYQIPRIYTDTEAFLRDDSFDTVYVGLVNSAHYEYTRRALEAGKNVICEKPFTATGRQARKLIKIAKAKGLFLFEAIMTRYIDNYDEIGRQLDKIGKVTLIQTNYSQYSRRFGRYLEGQVLPAFDPALAGGSLYDINLYCIQFIMGLFGKPQGVRYMANIGYNGIDTSGVLCMDYGDFKAVAVGAKDSDSPARSVIQGQKGYIEVQNRSPIVENVMLHLKGEEPVCIDVKPVGNAMANEFRKIAEIMQNGDYELCYTYMQKTQDVMDVMEAARKDAGIHFDADDEDDDE